MAAADIFDVLRELDAHKRFKECRLSVTRPSPLYGGHNRIREVSIHLPSEHDPELVAEVSGFAKRHGLEWKFEFRSLVLRLPD